MGKTSLGIQTVVELKAWAKKTLLINDQHKEEIVILCNEWLLGQGYKEPRPASPADGAVVVKEVPLTVENDPYFRRIDAQVAAIAAARAERGPLKKPRKQRADKGRPRVKRAKNKPEKKIRRKKS
jgi:hypothetical protein